MFTNRLRYGNLGFTFIAVSVVTCHTTTFDATYRESCHAPRLLGECTETR